MGAAPDMHELLEAVWAKATGRQRAIYIPQLSSSRLTQQDLGQRMNWSPATRWSLGLSG